MSEFYFLRHGQTDCNLGLVRGHQPLVPLNETGREQISRLKEGVSTPPIELICRSPLPRVVQTTEIFLGDHPAPHHVLDEIEECTWDEWMAMEAIDFQLEKATHPDLIAFIARTGEGLEKVLSFKQPLIVVAHGGVFNAFLHHLGIPWTRNAKNGELFHFKKDQTWQFQSLFIP